MREDKKEYLPAKADKFTVARLEQLSEIAIPPQFQGTTSLSEVTNARKEFENSNVGDTFSQLHEKYNRCYDDLVKRRAYSRQNPKPADGQQMISVSQRRKLARILEMNSLEEYRRKTGLDKLREKLKNMIVEHASFEKGLANLNDYISTKTNPSPIPSFIEKEEFKRAGVPQDAWEANLRYPDMTADEVSWLSFAEIPKNWIYNFPSPVYYPAALVDIDFDGLHFAHGTVDHRLEDSVNAANHFKVGGITGVSHQYQLVPFKHNISQAIKALVLLSINDKDIFRKIWDEHDSDALARGDAMLLKSFISTNPKKYRIPKDFDSKNIEDLVNEGKVSVDDIGSARKEIADYYTGVHISGAYIYNILDFVKLVGILSRVPRFIAEKKQFSGYAKLYGTTMQFVSDLGEIIDSVPLAEHIMHKTAYQFHNHITEASSKNKVMRDLLNEIQSRISQENAGKNRMLSDAVQEEIFEKFGIFVHTGVKTKKCKYDAISVVLSKSAEKDILVKTIKFSYKELCTIREILNNLPRGAAGNVRSIVKEISDANTVYTFRTGTVRAGYYDTKTKRVTIALPLKAPISHSPLDLLCDAILFNKKKRICNKPLLDIKFHYANFMETLLHEIGESIYANLDESLKREWQSLHNNADPKKLEDSFLTPYSRTSGNEDFSDHFALYYLRGAEFRKRALGRKVLQAKYEFMRRIWSADKPREFDNNIRFAITTISGRPGDDMAKLRVEEMVQEAFASSDACKIERIAFADSAKSYESIARKAERKGISKRKELEELVEDDDVSESKIRIEEMERSGRIRAFVIAKSDQLLCSLNVGSMDELGDFPYLIYHGMREDAVKILLNAGAKQKKAEKTVEKLIRLFDYFRDDLENFGEKIELSKEQSKSFERDIIETVRAVNEARKKNKIKQTDDEEQADFNEQMDGDET
ncbi:MAG: hypothetical protein QXK08_03725 [Candidatus Woesearchaeota archaeon]